MKSVLTGDLCFRYLREAEKMKKMEQNRQEKEAKQQQLLAEKKKRQEEQIRLKQEENLKKEQKRQMQEQVRTVVEVTDTLVFPCGERPSRNFSFQHSLETQLCH